MALETDIQPALMKAVREFWGTRTSQSEKQGLRTGIRDAGLRAAVTGGAQMDGFISLVLKTLIGTGVPESMLFAKRSVQLPGWFRAEKKWDLVVVNGTKPNAELLACVEFKSHIGPSFGNNFNNRTEEALGSGYDIGSAYREGAFRPSSKPWIGYFMLLEDAPGSRSSISQKEPHFSVFPEFRDASYTQRYRTLITKLVRDSLYTGACFITSNQSQGANGQYEEPDEELSFERFLASLVGHVTGHLLSHGLLTKLTPNAPKKRGKAAAE